MSDVNEIDVQCVFHHIDWHFILRKYTCSVHSVTKPGRAKSVEGFHGVGKSDDDIEGLSLKNVAFVPTGIAAFFRNIVAIEINNCGLEKISFHDLEDFKRLKMLSVTSNKLKVLPNDLFVKSRHLRWISFKDNQLEVLSSKILEPIPDGQLKYVDLSGNTKIDAFWNPHEKLDGKNTETLWKLKEVIDNSCALMKKPIKFNLFRDKISAGFRTLWGDGTFSDFTIIADSKEFKVHKCVLAIQSPVFAKLLTGDEKALESNVLAINGFSADVVEDFLRSLYSGEILFKDNAFELFSIAQAYEVSELKFFAETIIINNLDKTNAMKAFKLGHLNKSKALIGASFKKIQDGYSGVTISDSLINMPDRVEGIVDAFENYKKIVDDLNNLKVDA